MRALILLAGCLITGPLAADTLFDVVILGGRVMDPESGLDAVRNIGVKDGRILAITSQTIRGRAALNAAGQVVAPGFIDLHQHGHSEENYRALVHDGVTSALELEIGVEDPAEWYAEREGKALIHHGASISHPYSRNIAQTGANPGLEGEALTRELTEREQAETERLIAEGLNEGGVGVGFGIAYTPGATLNELTRIFAIAERYDAVCHVHMRTSRTDFSNLDEVLTAAERTGASLHVVHINSSGGDRALEYVERIRAARRRGLDVTTEAYPYNRGSTFIQSHLFDDWRTYDDEQFRQYIWVATGEKLNRKTFGTYREHGGIIISPPSYSEETVAKLMARPDVMVASDGMWLVDGRAHPRTFGTFSRVLGRYVREQNALTLMEALRKMSLLPAQRLERRVPAMANKGRVRLGADADLVVFDPAIVADQGTFENPAVYSVGFRHVLVGGGIVLRDGSLTPEPPAGRAIRGWGAR